jgi:hypothetical protein
MAMPLLAAIAFLLPGQTAKKWVDGCLPVLGRYLNFIYNRQFPSFPKLLKNQQFS